jgi:hypothetical protein
MAPAIPSPSQKFRIPHSAFRIRQFPAPIRQSAGQRGGGSLQFCLRNQTTTKGKNHMKTPPAFFHRTAMPKLPQPTQANPP